MYCSADFVFMNFFLNVKNAINTTYITYTITANLETLRPILGL